MNALSALGGAVVIDNNGAAFLAAAMLRRFEGLRLAPYLCAAGKPTIGYGHVILPSEGYLRGGITVDQAEMLLLRDLAWALYAARDVGRVLSDGQAAALASLVFNIGAAAWACSTIRGQVIAGDMVAAANQFGRWNKVRGVPNAGLTARRFREKQVFEGVSWTG
jgi:lysozyme